LSSPFGEKEVTKILQADFSYRVEKGLRGWEQIAAAKASPFEIDKGLA
jgi:hypothetical protein